MHNVGNRCEQKTKYLVSNGEKTAIGNMQKNKYYKEKVEVNIAQE